MFSRGHIGDTIAKTKFDAFVDVFSTFNRLVQFHSLIALIYVVDPESDFNIAFVHSHHIDPQRLWALGLIHDWGWFSKPAKPLGAERFDMPRLNGDYWLSTLRLSGRWWKGIKNRAQQEHGNEHDEHHF
jgi:hypothetical protein